MDKYTQLSLENRHQIEALLKAGHNQSEIARAIGVHRSISATPANPNIAGLPTSSRGRPAGG